MGQSIGRAARSCHEHSGRQGRLSGRCLDLVLLTFYGNFIIYTQLAAFLAISDLFSLEGGTIPSPDTGVVPKASILQSYPDLMVTSSQLEVNLGLPAIRHLLAYIKTLRLKSPRILGIVHQKTRRRPNKYFTISNTIA